MFHGSIYEPRNSPVNSEKSISILEVFLKQMLEYILLPKFPQTSEELRQPQLLAHVYGLLVSCHLCPWFHLSVHFPVFLRLAVGCTAVHVPCGPAGCADVPLVLLR